jgi:hypothetical protein
MHENHLKRSRVVSPVEATILGLPRAEHSDGVLYAGFLLSPHLPNVSPQSLPFSITAVSLAAAWPPVIHFVTEAQGSDAVGPWLKLASCRGLVPHLQRLYLADPFMRPASPCGCALSEPIGSRPFPQTQPPPTVLFLHFQWSGSKTLDGLIVALYAPRICACIFHKSDWE